MSNRAAQPGPDTLISSHLLLRITVLLIAVWTAIAGGVLLAVHGVSSGALGAGISDPSGQRLVGVHMLLLVPVYLLIVVRYEHYSSLIWLPFAAQLSVAVVLGYGMVTGKTSFSNGILAFAVGLIFVALFSFLWITQQRDAARMKMEAEEKAAADGPGNPASAGQKPDPHQRP